MNDEAMKRRIRKIIKEHYDETTGEVLSLNITTAITEKVYIVQSVVAYMSDDDYTIHTETVRVDDKDGLTFTLLSEHDLQLKDEL